MNLNHALVKLEDTISDILEGVELALQISEEIYDYSTGSRDGDDGWREIGDLGQKLLHIKHTLETAVPPEVRQAFLDARQSRDENSDQAEMTT